MIARDRLVQATSAMINAAKSPIVTAPEDLRRSLEGLSRKNLRNALQKVSYAETGCLMNVRFLEEYDAWLKSQAKREG